MVDFWNKSPIEVGRWLPVGDQELSLEEHQRQMGFESWVFWVGMIGYNQIRFKPVKRSVLCLTGCQEGGRDCVEGLNHMEEDEDGEEARVNSHK